MSPWRWLGLALSAACAPPCEQVWYEDLDGDGFGDEASAREACEAPQAFVAAGGDCDDADAGIHPEAFDACDTIDQDCDGEVDEDEAARTTYLDADGDGFGASATWTGCGLAPHPFTATVTGDCDDLDPAVNPHGKELCNGIDDDCNGRVDDAEASDPYAFPVQYGYADLDGDGYPGSFVLGCGDVSLQGRRWDCDDGRPEVVPFGEERCNGRDDDCDGYVDEDPIDGEGTWADYDGDDFGDPELSVVACPGADRALIEYSICDELPSGYQIFLYDYGYYGYYGADYCEYIDWYYGTYGVDGRLGWPWFRVLSVPVARQAGDCDDWERAVYPGREEVCNGVDDNCNGLVDDEDPTTAGADQDPFFYDFDNDGYGDDEQVVWACARPLGYRAEGGDCADRDAAVHPDQAEICNGVDDDCDGEVDLPGCP